MTPTNGVFLWILFGHFVADFVMQSRWMGNNKSSNFEAMFAHIATYMAMLFLFVGWVAPFSVLAFAYVFVNGLAHLTTDLITSNVTKYCWGQRTEAKEKEKQDKWEHLFWCTIGFDQFLHVFMLFISFPMLIS